MINNITLFLWFKLLINFNNIYKKNKYIKYNYI